MILFQFIQIVVRQDTFDEIDRPFFTYNHFR